MSDVDDGVGEAPVAGAVQPRLEAQLEDGAALGPADDELGLHLLRDGQVALAAELDRLEGDLLLVSMLFAGPQPERTQAEESGHRRGRSASPSRPRA